MFSSGLSRREGVTSKQHKQNSLIKRLRLAIFSVVLPVPLLLVSFLLHPSIALGEDKRDFGKSVEDWLRETLGENGSWLGDMWRDQRLLCYATLAALAVALIFAMTVILKKISKKLTQSDSNTGRFLAKRRVSQLLRKGEFRQAGEILKRLDRKKEAADAYFKGQCWSESAELYFSLGVKLKAARAYERDGNHSTAAVTYEGLGEYEAAEQCFRELNDLRSVAKMYSKIGQHKKAAGLFKEMNLSRDEAEALELAGMHEESLAIWRVLFSNYEKDATNLTPLALRERNTVAAHVYLNLEKFDVDEARAFLSTISLAEGISDVFQKRGEFQKAVDIKNLLAEIEQTRLSAAAALHRAQQRHGHAGRAAALGVQGLAHDPAREPAEARHVGLAAGRPVELVTAGHQRQSDHF